MYVRGSNIINQTYFTDKNYKYSPNYIEYNFSGHSNVANDL